MAGNDIYNDRTERTQTSMLMTRERAREFMRQVSMQPTHPTKQWIVTDAKTGDPIYHTNL